MVFRLAGMAGAAWAAVALDWVRDGRAGALLFLAGVIIECAVSWWKGRRLRKLLPYELDSHPVRSPKHVTSFLLPLVLASLIGVIIMPAINLFLGWTIRYELALASFSIALGVSQLFISLSAYMHQVAIQFYAKHPGMTVKFAFVSSLAPAFLLSAVCFTPPGEWFLQSVIGITGELYTATRDALIVYLIMALAFPWVDFMNGIVMAKRRTKWLTYSQIVNVTVTLAVLAILVRFFADWNGAIGAWAMSLGIIGEGLFVSIALIAAGRSWTRRQVIHAGEQVETGGSGSNREV